MSKKKNKLDTVLSMSNEKTLFESKYMHIIMIAVLVIVVSTIFFKIAFLNYAPPASDTMQWRGSAQQLLEYNKTHWMKAQWTDNMFGGMPSYLISLPNQYPFIDSVAKIFTWFLDWRIFFLIFAGIGMYVLMIHLKFDPMIALFGALSFALSCHFIGLIEIGHNTKFKAIMYIPWIFWSVDYLRKNRNLLGLGFASIFIIQQLRENHPQISYYTYLMLGAYWLVLAICSVKDKKVKDFVIYTLLLILVFSIAGLAVANPYMNTYEYGKYTIRGGSDGLTKEYATGWSFGKAEILTFLVPKFLGGISPYYWGNMAFTQTLHYFGIIIFFLALVALVFVRRKVVWALGISSILAVFLSFGKNMPFLYDFFFNYIPGFNKFRVPSMILILIQFSFVVLAGFGLDYIIRKRNDNPESLKKFIKISLFVVIGIVLLFVIGKSIFAGLPFVKAEELQQYDSSQLSQIKQMRLDLLVKSGIQSFMILLVSIGLIMGYLSKKMHKNIMLLGIILLGVIDLATVNTEHLKSDSLVKENEMFATFENNAIDDYLNQDKDVYRIFPLAQQFGDTRWSYNHQSLGGYHGAKLKRYQTIIEKSLYAELIKGIPLNWNVINMLNTKYIIFNNQLPFPNLQEVYVDNNTGLYVYKNLSALPRAWFVKNVRVINDEDKIINTMNTMDFNPAQTAIVEENVEQVFAPDSTIVKLTERDIHHTKWDLTTDKKAFLTISEVYYPAGWRVYIDGKETKIYATNYVLRGIVVPAGTHQVEMKFVPKTYNLSIILSAIGLGISLIFLIIGVILHYKRNYRGEIVYVVKKD